VEGAAHGKRVQGIDNPAKGKSPGTGGDRKKGKDVQGPGTQTAGGGELGGGKRRLRNAIRPEKPGHTEEEGSPNQDLFARGKKKKPGELWGS